MIDAGLKKVVVKEDEKEENIPPSKISFDNVEKHITENKIAELEWVLITHNHGDHIGGLQDLLGLPNLKVKTIYTKEYIGTDKVCKDDYATKSDDWDTLKSFIEGITYENGEKIQLNIIYEKKK